MERRWFKVVDNVVEKRVGVVKGIVCIKYKPSVLHWNNRKDAQPSEFTWKVKVWTESADEGILARKQLFLQIQGIQATTYKGTSWQSFLFHPIP